MRESGSLYSKTSNSFAGKPYFARDKRQVLVSDL